MQEEIEIRHCASCRPIERDEGKYRTDILANGCFWKESLEADHSLEEIPEPQKDYFVFLKQPVRFHLGMELWLYYDCPSAFYNGYESENEIEQAVFCLGKITGLLNRNDFGAMVVFNVSATISLKEIINSRQEADFPEFWNAFLKDFILRNDYTLEKFGSYYYLSVNAESDLGLTCLISMHKEKPYICMVNEWRFSENNTFGGKYIVPNDISKLLK